MRQRGRAGGRCALLPSPSPSPLPARSLPFSRCLSPFPSLPPPSRPTSPRRTGLGSGTTLSAGVLSALSLRQHHPEGEAAGHGGAPGSAGHGPVPAEPQRHRAHHPAAEGGRRCSPRSGLRAAALGLPSGMTGSCEKPVQGRSADSLPDGVCKPGCLSSWAKPHRFPPRTRRPPPPRAGSSAMRSGDH